MSLWRLSSAARSDIVHIYADGIVKFGEAQALRYRTDLEACFDTLCAAPGIGREHIGADQPVLVHFHQAHVVVYQALQDSILIVRLLPGRSDWRTHLP